MKQLLTLICCAFFVFNSMGQDFEPKHGFIYSEGLSWTENKKQDSVKQIIIEGDTMTAIRNLLIFCLQEKEEGDYARILLMYINLNHMEKLINDKTFSFYLKEYRKTIAKTEKARKKKY